MRVYRQSEARCAVAKSFLDHLGVYSRPEEVGGVSMTEVVESERAQTGLVACLDVATTDSGAVLVAVGAVGAAGSAGSGFLERRDGAFGGGLVGS